ncbi:MAG TPA: calcium/sodium antiporter [Gammaproteobacteria bacterium]|nr:calcium/sodium antiporter [Gammaproteobacteria bacterium]
MLLQAATIAIGFAVLTWSADCFVAGASATARRLGVSTLIIGMTVVGFGTSAPEMLVSAIAAWQGNAGIALGNAVGSNITNVGLILGVTSLLYPLQVRSRILHRELPVLLLVMAVTLALCLDGTLSRLNGVALLAGLVLLLAWLTRVGARSGDGPDVMGLEFEAHLHEDLTLGAALWRLILGLVLLLASSRALVWAAVGIAESLGVSDLVIGLTVVALGTSLPELAASVASARKGEHDIALGNVIGSNMFNLFGVLGIASTITPFGVSHESLVRDFPVMVAITVGLFVMAYGFRGRGRINRIEGLLLLAAYLGYQGYLLVTQL